MKQYCNVAVIYPIVLLVKTWKHTQKVLVRPKTCGTLHLALKSLREIVLWQHNLVPV